MATIGDTLPHCTGTGTQADPYIFSDVYGFAEAIAVVDAYVEATTSNIVWNCNTDAQALPCPITIKCLEIQAKGFTIINALVQNQNTSVFYIYRTTKENVQKIYGLNAYNVCIINYNLPMCLIDDNTRYSEYPAALTELHNCNFAGVCIGYSNTSRDGSSRKNFIAHDDGNRYLNFMQYRMYNCTFNFNLSDPTNTSGKNFVFHCEGKGYGSTFVYLDNCTLCFSGSVSDAFSISAIANNTTFMNKQSNPLTCSIGNINIMAEPSLSGYNYHKMYITANSGNLKDAQGLWNTSRYAYSNPTYQGIQMQETDPSLNTYIYDDANLAAAGFLVGEVII